MAGFQIWILRDGLSLISFCGVQASTGSIAGVHAKVLPVTTMRMSYYQFNESSTVRGVHSIRRPRCRSLRLPWDGWLIRRYGDWIDVPYGPGALRNSQTRRVQCQTRSASVTANRCHPPSSQYTVPPVPLTYLCHGENDNINRLELRFPALYQSVLPNMDEFLRT